MREAGTRWLLVDVRSNDGGNSSMADILVFFLHGKRALLDVRSARSEVRKLSPLLLEPREGIDLAAISAREAVELRDTDYDFGRDYSGSEHVGRVEAVAAFERDVRRMPTFAEAYFSQAPPELPELERVVVLCSPFTFSSGYTLMHRLYRTGALIVGTASAQQGNCFGDIVEIRLQHSRLSATVSHKQFLYFPDDPELGEVLPPHFPLDYQTLAAFGFDPHAEILLALDVLESKAGG
jgi:hypothetical protein